MTNKEVQIIKKEIVRALTEDLCNTKGRVRNQAIFIKPDGGYGSGCQVFNNTDLTMVMDAVVYGLKRGQEKINQGDV